MIKFLLDTNAVISLLNDVNSSLSRRVREHLTSDIGISSIVSYELFYGAFKSQRTKRNVALVDCLQFEVLEFDKEDSRFAGEIRAQLTKQGTPIGPYDVLIAGQARARDITLITNNMKEFERVTGLLVEDWQ